MPGDDYLASVSSKTYDGKSSNGDITDVLDKTLNQVGIAGEIAPKDVPVPTWLAAYTRQRRPLEDGKRL